MEKPETAPIDIHEERIVKEIHHLIESCGESPQGLAGDLVTQMIQTSLRLMKEKHSMWQLKLINRALKEMRYAYNIFNQYPDARCISIFGSARTPEGHRDYLAAKAFSTHMADLGWMCITGAANGIMRAATEGAQAESSFGLSIRLPFEIPTNTLLEGDPKLMIFRYFFTRKLMFIGHSDAIAAFPGGVGTLDELFEVLTLMQTGKAEIVPLVLVEGKSGRYWKHWQEYITAQLLNQGWISPTDRHLYHIAPTPEAAKDHILQFYRRYHSSRYVKEQLVIRMLTPLNRTQLQKLNRKYRSLVQSGEMVLRDAFPEETDHLELPRLAFHHTRRDFGLIRALIDSINEF